MRSKKHMTIVRKVAMRSYLEHDGKKSKKSRKPRLVSEESTGSQPGIGVQDVAIINPTSGERAKTQSRTQNRQSHTVESTQLRQTLSPETHRSMRQGVHEGLLGSAPIVVPPRLKDDDGKPLPYIRKATPLFVSFGEGVDPFKTMFQSSYPRVSVERMKFLCARFFGTYAMGRHWIPTVLSAPHTFLSTLCCASAHLDAICDRNVESVETSSLRQEVIHLISQNMVHPGKKIDDTNLTAVIQLIVSEIIGREEISLKINKAGLETMIFLRGGLNQLGMSGYLASTITWVLLESAILLEERPNAIYSDYATAHSTKKYPVTATIPESPLYRPRPQFETLKRSRYYKKETLDLLEDVHAMIELFLNPTESTRRGSRALLNYYKDITTKYPSISSIQHPTQDDYKYEAIRIAAIIQAIAIIERIPLTKALPRAATMVSRRLSTAYTISTSLQSADSPTSPLSPMNVRHDSITSPTTVSSYASSLTFQPSNSYFDTPRTSISSVTTSHRSMSSIVSYPSLSSAATSHSSVSSTSSRPSIHFSRSRQPLLTTFSPPDDYNPFAEFTAPPISNASISLLSDLRAALDASNMSECWQDMTGVLLWIGLTIGAASHKNGNRILEKWYSALSMRASILLSFEHPEAMHSTLLKMGRVVEALSETYSSSRAGATRPLTEWDIEAPGKKRRTLS